MRLAILTQYYPPETGAPQARLSELAARFVARGHEVVVLTAMPKYPGGRVNPGYGGLMRREELAESPDERREMGERGRRAAETRFHRLKIAHAFIDRLDRELVCAS